ncbi:MAG TPA: alpha/beta fold hydrolase [Candidatus Cybelea sp.]|nr:alpha/beta fold hydrolase [Candidatus Cybelea sp.]
MTRTAVTYSLTRSLARGLEGLPPFRPRLPWLGGDLQTVRNWLVKPKPPIENWPAEPILFDMADDTGDRLGGLLHRPHEDRQRPLIVLVHGLTGSVESSYIRTSAVHLLRAGYPVLRLNLRGSGKLAPRSTQFYHAGRSEDLHRVIGTLDGRLVARGLILVGYSMGGNLILKYLAERGAMAAVMAAASISAPIDLQAAQRRIASARNRLYHRQLLGWMLRERGGGLDPAIRTIIDFDNRIVAPANGFKDALDYYRQCSSAPLLGAIRRPTLIVHAGDDPWIPAAMYREIAWSKHARLLPLIPPSGGHVGFHSSGLSMPWHDAAVLRFLATLS